MAALGQRLATMMRSLRAYERSLQHPLFLYHKEADARGVHLLTRHMSPAQREQYLRHGYFEVIGGDTGWRYRIREGYAMNVEQLDEKGRRIQLLCFAPRGGLPVGDVMLAQKIALELFESATLRVANRSVAWEHLLQEDMRRRHPSW
jgi:hypothetical protein